MRYKLLIMKRFFNLTWVAVFMILFASCGEATVDENALNLAVDKQAAVEIDKITAEVNANCETRMATEMKQKTDSIINALQIANAGQ